MFWNGLRKFLEYYERTHNLRTMHIYTDELKYKRTLDGFSMYRDSHPSCLTRQCPSVEATIISKTNAKSWYHSQRLASFGCMYMSFTGCYEWIICQDLDEVLSTPFMARGWTWSVIPDQIQGISLGSWPFDGRHGNNSGNSCLCPEMSSLQSEPGGKAVSTERTCLRCIIGSKGCRKYAINDHFFER